jgi:amidohydrolase
MDASRGRHLDLDRSVAGDLEALLALRHAMHREPELSGAEHVTTARVEAALDGVGARIRRGPKGVGLIVDVGPPGPRVAVRADLDALALDEAVDVPYASCVPGVMHACGHDVHTASLVGAARALASACPERPFRFLFQPAEEATPGGALDLIAAGAMEDVTAILMLHCDPTRPVGRVGVQAGPVTAASDTFEVTLRGTGGHGARPHETQDLVLALAQALQALHLAFDRAIDDRVPHVLSVGTVHAGRTSANVIPDRAVFTGTVRTVDPATRERVEPVFRRALDGVAAAWDVAYDLKLTRGAPPVINDARVAEAVRLAASEALGADGVEALGPPSMGAEDFGWYLAHAPGALLRLGVGVGAPLHSASFRADDAAIAIGARVLARAALHLPQAGPSS